MGAREGESAPTATTLSAVYETNSLRAAPLTHARSVLSVFMGVHRPKHEAPSTLRALNFIDRRISALSYIIGTPVHIHALNHTVDKSGREMRAHAWCQCLLARLEVICLHTRKHMATNMC